MFAILRAWAIAFILLSVIYWMLRVYFRSTHREKLEKRFDAGDVPGDRDAYIKAGMADYGRSLRLRLVWLVYVLPLLAIAAIIYSVNYD
ncbi:hypothetical protein SAMN04488103_11077 [Gemmobacter aquatilis]|uniref:Cation/multidrug efflux pump n=1 Tax=Gemmobacter aquatilis TaxID=933059 RepID=A0A1H8L258_9RHOB|nr:hypothetical protein [Gemmobacter aquatilis]SEN99233.1 hypothetical protein SAMN04488103_11077 [Gemmobacter aquatilis]